MNIENREFAEKVKRKLQELLIRPGFFKYPKAMADRLKFAMSLYVRENPDGSVTIESTHPAFRYLDLGVRPHLMTYLVGKTVPLKDNVTGKVLFRRVTLASIARGSWHHPGIIPQKYIETAVREAMKEMAGKQ